MTTTLTTLPAFTTMSDYKTWRAAWRVEYAQLTLDIRATKQSVRQAQRDHSIAMYGSGGTAAQRVAITTAMSVIWKTLSTLNSLRLIANSGLNSRIQSKILAAQLYAASNKKVV
jgi:carbon monoxide dehydrogenase subunit G